MRTPSISYVIATFNSEKTLGACLSSIHSQAYPERKTEIVIADGGSKDATFAIAKKYGAQIVKVNTVNQGPEYNRAVGAHRAKNEILSFLDHDNELPHRNWLMQMVQPFIDDTHIIGAETLRYLYNKKETLLSRYFSLFGVNDVLPFYMGKADRLSYMYDSLSQYGVFRKAKIEEKRDYSIVSFAKGAVPTLGSNGFLIRRILLFRHAKTDPQDFFHIDVNVDLINKGFNTYAFVDNTILHKTDERGIFDYFRRRKLFMVKYHLKDHAKRRYSVYEKKDLGKLLLFILYSSTFVKPFIDSLRGFAKVKDMAWFIHPVVCFGTLIVYGSTFLEFTITKTVWRKTDEDFNL